MTARYLRQGPNKRRTTALALLLGTFAIGVGFACIIPDNDIQVLTTDFNQYPVRFIEGIPLDKAARCACSAITGAETCECPLPAITGLPTYLDPEDPAYQFCICGDNQIDEGRLTGVTLYAEDQDEVDGIPDDALYAAALLDWDPSYDDSAFDYVAYRNYLDPRSTLKLSAHSTYETGVIKRARPYVRSLDLDLIDPGGFDLCNGAGRPLGPGYHTLSIMVTDRLWFQRDDDGMLTTLDGVPDIAAGATYDVQTYVFHCYEETDDQCGCVVNSDEP